MAPRASLNNLSCGLSERIVASALESLSGPGKPPHEEPPDEKEFFGLNDSGQRREGADAFGYHP